MARILFWWVAALVCVPGLSWAADNVAPLASSGALAVSDVSISKTQVARHETVTSKDGILVLRTPPTAKSVVVRLQAAR